jgi:hypothetical protein
VFCEIHDTGSYDDKKNSEYKTQCQLIFPLSKDIADHVGGFRVGCESEQPEKPEQAQHPENPQIKYDKCMKV